MNPDYIFVFSSGMKTGSTLIQRFLNSHKDILIWGENLSLYSLKLHSRLEEDSDRYKHQYGLSEYIKNGYDTYAPRMFMDSSILCKYIKDYIESILQCKELDVTKNKIIFGCKQVWYKCDYMLLLDKYLSEKNLKYIYITRNMVDCYLSCKKIWGKENYRNNWTRVNTSFLRLESQLKNIIILRYEDIIQDPLNNFGLKVCNYLNMNIEDFDMNVFNNKLGSSEININDKQDLTEEELSKLFTKNTIECCKRFNYSYNINDYLIQK